MNIITDTLQTNKLSANEIFIKNMDIKEYFESKLSCAVQFVGVFDALSSVPSPKNGYIAIVGGVEYIYNTHKSPPTWEILGDETEPIGIDALNKINNLISGDFTTLSTAVSSLNIIDGKITKDKISDFGNYLTSNALNAISSNWDSAYQRISALTVDIPSDAKFTDTTYSGDNTNISVQGNIIKFIGETGNELSVVTQDQFHEMVRSGSLSPKFTYVISGDHINAYNQQIRNLKDATADNHAATYGQLGRLDTSLRETITSETHAVQQNLDLSVLSIYNDMEKINPKVTFRRWY